MSKLWRERAWWWLPALAVLGLAGCGEPWMGGTRLGGRPTAPLQQQSPGLAHTAVHYLPNRALDLLDIVSVGVAIPTSSNLLPSFLHLNVHATRFVQLGAGETRGVFYGHGYGRRWEWGMDQDERSLGPFTDTRIVFSPVPGRTERDLRTDCSGVLDPGDAVFAKDGLDYWALGAHIGILYVALGLDIHPVEIADALLGFFTIDIRRDDK